MIENFEVHNLIQKRWLEDLQTARKDRRHAEQLYVVDNLLQLQSFKRKGYPQR